MIKIVFLFIMTVIWPVRLTCEENKDFNDLLKTIKEVSMLDISNKRMEMEREIYENIDFMYKKETFISKYEINEIYNLLESEDYFQSCIASYALRLSLNKYETLKRLKNKLDEIRECNLVPNTSICWYAANETIKKNICQSIGLLKPSEIPNRCTQD